MNYILRNDVGIHLEQKNPTTFQHSLGSENIIHLRNFWSLDLYFNSLMRCVDEW